MHNSERQGDSDLLRQIVTQGRQLNTEPKLAQPLVLSLSPGLKAHHENSVLKCPCATEAQPRVASLPTSRSETSR